MAQQLKDAAAKMFKTASSRAGSGGGPSIPPGASTAVGAIAGAGVLAYVGAHSYFTVEGGKRAVVFNRLTGMKDTVYGEGLNFNIPWFEWPVHYDVRTRPCNLQTLTGSKDLQMVTIGVRVLHKPDTNELVQIYRQLGMDYEARVLPSLMNECAKAVVARFNANELLTKREAVSAEIGNDLRVRAKKFNLLLEDVAITHLSFSPEYSRAVEAKQVAQQDAERSKYIVLGAKNEKQTIITKAKGEAQSAELIGESVKNNPGFMSLRRIEAAQEIATIVASSGNKVYLNADSLLLNLLGDADDKFEKGMGTKKKGFFGR